MDSLVNARCICLSYIDCLHAHGRIKSQHKHALPFRACPVAVWSAACLAVHLQLHGHRRGAASVYLAATPHCDDNRQTLVNAQCFTPLVSW